MEIAGKRRFTGLPWVFPGFCRSTDGIARTCTRRWVCGETKNGRGIESNQLLPQTAPHAKLHQGRKSRRRSFMFRAAPVV